MADDNANKWGMPMDPVQKARMDRARLATAQPMGPNGQPVSQNSWVTFLDGVDKTPWEQHTQYQPWGSNVQAQEPGKGGGMMGPMESKSLSPYGQPAQYNIDPSVLMNAHVPIQGPRPGVHSIDASKQKPWNTPEYIKKYNANKAKGG